jgi:hypothetical protein
LRVNHLVQRDEVRALYVPRRLLGQQRQIDGVSEPGVEDVDRHRLGVRGQVVVGTVLRHFDFLHCQKPELVKCRSIG